MRQASSAMLGEIGRCRMMPNNALERSVTRLAMGAAGASESLAPAAPGSAIPRPAQRGR